LPLVLCGFENWSLTVRGKCRLRAFEDRALRKIYGHKRDDITG